MGEVPALPPPVPDVSAEQRFGRTCPVNPESDRPHEALDQVCIDVQLINHPNVDCCTTAAVRYIHEYVTEHTPIACSRDFNAEAADGEAGASCL